MRDRDMQLPLSFRADLLGQIMPALRAGECCSLVGASGVGKSNLVRFLQRPDVQSAYWGDESTWVVLIDTNSLVFDERPDEYIVAELMIYRLIREAERRNMPAEFIADLDTKYVQVVERPSAQLALRYLERVCGRICETSGIRIVFAFDQFEDLWKPRGARLFLNLRHLRDEFKYRLVYLVMTREQLPRSRDDRAVVESFWELFTSHTYGLGMYGASDANSMIDRLTQRRDSAVLDDNLRQTIIDASGGHPGLLRAVFWALHAEPSAAVSYDKLLLIDAVAGECAKLWDDLLPEEQQLMRVIATGATPLPLDDPTLADLQLKQLVRGDPPALFSSLFAAYARGQAGIDMSGIVVAPRLRQVWLDGMPLAKVLSPLEFSLLEYLARHAGEVCHREAILRELYKDQAFNTNDERLDTLLRRLRETLDEDARNPRYLITHRGVGFQLVDGRIQE
jgi:DNA-binding winged helix-turn-helix (wHTH) protein